MAKPGKSMDGKRTAADDIAIAERNKKILDLRIGGMSFPAIARQVGLSGPGAVFKIYRKLIREVYRESAEEALTLEIEKTNRVHMALFPRAIGSKDLPPDYKAVDCLVKVWSRYDSLLGIDARTVIQIEQHRDHGERIKALEQGIETGESRPANLPPRAKPTTENGNDD